MQLVKQGTKFGQRGSRSHWCSDGKPVTLDVRNPRRKTADGSVRQFAKKVLSFRTIHPSLNTKTLSKQRVKLVMDLDDLGSMGIMFLSLAGQARRTSAWR